MTFNWTLRHSLGTIVRDGPRFVVDEIRRWVVRQYYSRYFTRNPDHRALDATAATEAVRSADSITFLCLGNVCRSPLAERYLQNRLAPLEVGHIGDGEHDAVSWAVSGETSVLGRADRAATTVPTVASAGLGRKQGRESPGTAIEVACEFGVDLTTHRSVRATPELIDDSDVVFVMDYANYHTTTRRYPAVADRTFFLRPLADGDAVIDDPYGSSYEQFESVYGTIVDALDSLAAVLAEPRRGTDESGDDRASGGT